MIVAAGEEFVCEPGTAAPVLDCASRVSVATKDSSVSRKELSDSEYDDDVDAD